MRIRSFIWAALFAALTAVGGLIKIPVPGDLVLCVVCSVIAARVWPRIRPIIMTQRVGG
ncbi:hypothetical protein [Geobacillus jurassicus]|uniref:Uncharacterized protein n=1 Tax=Geobacillus jurassicus TaxID=235932 RepID=A0ABV6GXW4_9BACL|nr:hypothetical protein [Geobacillus jurassicus]